MTDKEIPLYINEKYAKLLSPKLELFKWDRDGVANFRCPLCGDSEKSKTKKRGYIYTSKNKLFMKCHNCHASMPFNAFLKIMDENLYKDYIYEAFKYNNEYRWYEKKAKNREDTVKRKLNKNKTLEPALQKLEKVINLDDNHHCKQYVKQRKIPFRYWNDLYYTDDFQNWVNDSLGIIKFEKPIKGDKRLIIPFRNMKGQAYAYQGRSLDENNSLRYITINPSDSMLIYGLDKVNPKKKMYVFEGPIDSMYINNSLAVAGSALQKILKVSKNSVFVFDNEPRSKEIVKIMEKAIDAGANIVIWPNDIKEKDVGKMIENGITGQEIIDILEENTYTSTLRAKHRFNNWKKI